LKMEDNKKENYVFKKIQELPMVTRRIKIRWRRGEGVEEAGEGGMWYGESSKKVRKETEEVSSKI
jgi:hypothetical protein